ncbi:MAG: hypothetical protein RJA09_26 [Pseudomonadota bacterium]
MDTPEPLHNRALAEGLPAAPGVYTFHGSQPTLPLYIGKSVNIRNRVLAHLRNPDEAAMVKQTVRVSHIRTAGDIGAQLLEAELIKAQQPLYNQRLRRNRQLCSWQWDTQGCPILVHAKDVDFAHTSGLFGLYASRHAAINGLRELADQHQLCEVLLGLEKAAKGRGCFRSTLRRCAGACCGQEPIAEHHRRLQQAFEGLRVLCWPHPGPLGLVERWSEPDPMVQVHVVHNWCYLGSVPNVKAAARLARTPAHFDADGYKILCRPLLQGAAQVIHL